MTIGIYALYWWEQDLVYIGQSKKSAKKGWWLIGNNNGKKK